MTGRVSLRWSLLYAAARVGIGAHDVFFNSIAGFFLAGYGLSNMAIGFLANERSLFGSLLQPFAGAWSDRLTGRWGRRKPFMLLLIPVALGFVVLATAPPLPVMLVVFVLGPVAMGIGATAYEVLMPDIVREDQRGTVNGINRALMFVAAIILLWLASAVWQESPWIVFLLVAVTLVVGMVITMVGIEEPPPPAQLEPPMAFHLAEYFRELFRLKAAVWLVVAYFVYWFGMGGITPFITRFANSELGIPQGETLILLLPAMFGTLFAVTPAGWLGDRFGKKLITQWGILGFGLIILAGSMVQTREEVVVIMALAGVGQAVPTALAYPLFTETVPSRRMGELSGMSTMIWSIAQPLGATFFGLLADGSGTLRTVLAGGAISLIVASVLLMRMPRPGAEVQEVPVAAAEPG